MSRVRTSTTHIRCALLLAVLATGPAHAQDFILLGEALDDALLFASPADVAPGVCNFTPATELTSRVAGLPDGRIAVLTTDERIAICDGPGDLSAETFDLRTLVPATDAHDLCGMSDGRLAVLTAANEVLIVSVTPGAPALDKTVNVPTIAPNTDPVHVACLTGGRFAVSTAKLEILAFDHPDDTQPALIAADACRAASGQDLVGLTDGRIAMLNTNWPAPLYTVTVYDVNAPSACPYELSLSRCAVDTALHHQNVLAATRDNGLLMFHPFTEEFCVLRSPEDPDPVEPPIATALPNFTATHVAGFPFGTAHSPTTTTTTSAGAASTTTSTTDASSSTTTSTIVAGNPCDGVVGCGGIVVPCDTTAQTCVVVVPGSNDTVTVTVVAPASSPCRVVMIRLGKKARQAVQPLAADGASRAKSEFSKRAKKNRRLSKIVQGTIDSAGRLEVPLKLNPVGKRLLKPKKDGAPREVDASVLVEVTAGDGEPRLLEKLIKLVR